MAQASKGDGIVRRNQKGQGLTEAAIVVTLLMMLTLGAVDFGYSFVALHFLTQAASAGARVAATYQVGSRDSCGCFKDSSAVNSTIKSFVKSEVGSVATVSTVTVVQNTVNNSGTCVNAATPTIAVTVTGTIPRVTGLFGSTPVSFSRTETFRDEGV